MPLAACAPYRAGSFQTGLTRFPEQRTSRGCLDIGLAAAYDSEAEGPVLDVYLGNRCDESVWVDLSALQVNAQLSTGERIFVGLYDPRAELQPALLGGRESVMERIELEAPTDSVVLCAYLDALSAAASAGPEQVLCAEVAGA